MPTRANVPCKQPGCPEVVPPGSSYCKAHKPKSTPRPKRTKNDYGARWQKLRKIQLNKYPFCAECHRQGITTAANEVDHILPKSRGGGDEFDNLQSLCKSCHSQKTWAENHGKARFSTSMIPVTIVSGPPGSGKTTWVHDKKVAGDIVIDVDALYVALSGNDWYDKPIELLPFVIEARDAVIRRLSRHSDARHCWLITSEPDVERLTQLKNDLSANQIVVLETDANECLKRIRLDERRSARWQLWEPLVQNWWETYRASEG